MVQSTKLGTGWSALGCGHVCIRISICIMVQSKRFRRADQGDRRAASHVGIRGGGDGVRHGTGVNKGSSSSSSDSGIEWGSCILAVRVIAGVAWDPEAASTTTLAYQALGEEIGGGWRGRWRTSCRIIGPVLVLLFQTPALVPVSEARLDREAIIVPDRGEERGRWSDCGCDGGSRVIHANHSWRLFSRTGCRERGSHVGWQPLDGDGGGRGGCG